MRLFGDLACFEFEGFTAGELDTNFGCFWFHNSILFVQEGDAAQQAVARRVSQCQ
jgi:hypothetical protein